MAMGTDMSGMSGTMTTSTAIPTSTAMSKGGMGGSNGCKISMLWNWNTIDACFIARSWQVRTTAQFAGSCIGVVLLVVTLEALRRAAKEYDAYLVRQCISRQEKMPALPPLESDRNESKTATVQTTVSPCVVQKYRPTVLQQGVRALLHMLQFAVAYFVMLLAMYYNGYIIICILIGAFIGAFAFSWQSIDVNNGTQQQREITYCCG